MRVGILVSHPIQYHAVYFRHLSKACDLHVYFAHRPTAKQQGVGFGDAFSWDVDLLSGYEHTFLKNVSSNPGTGSFFGCDTPEIVDAIRTNSFEAFVVFGWFLKSYWQAVRACRQQHIPVLVRGDSTLQTPRSRAKRWIKDRVQSRLLKQFDGFLYVGTRNAEYLKHYGVSEDRMFFVPHFVDNKWFAEKAERNAQVSLALREKWQRGKNCFVALFVGKLIPEKRVSDLIEAIGRLAARKFPISAAVVGSGELENDLRKQAQNLRIDVFFEGFKNQSELSAYYRAADAVVLPSESETWGLVVNEAMACGLPAIISDAVGCAPDLIDAGRTGFTYPVRNAAALAERIEQMTELLRAGVVFQPALNEKLSSYSVEVAVNGLIRAVEAVLQSHVHEIHE